MQNKKDSTLKTIKFINRCYWPDSEATGQLLTELCEYLAPRWNVEAIVGQPNWNAEGKQFVSSGVERRNGVRVNRLSHRQMPKNRKFARLCNLFSFTFAVRKWGKSLPVMTAGCEEVIVCETDPFLLPLIVGPIARRRRARLFYYLQDIYPDVAISLGITADNVVMRGLRKRLKAEYEQAEGIVVLDDDMKQRLGDWGIHRSKMTIVPNWIDCNAVKPIKVQNAFRRAESLEDKFVVMHSGNMGMTQRLDVLVDAMGHVFKNEVAHVGGLANKVSELSGIQTNIVLVLIGNGARKKDLEKYAACRSYIRFMDYQPKEHLAESLSAADLHVVSMDQSITGCLAPSKLYGILASGTAILAIVPKGNSVWRLVEEEMLGWTVEPGNIQGIAKAIGAAKSTPESILLEMGQRGRRIAEENFDREICCRKFESLLRF